MRADPHSYSDTSQGTIRHLALRWTVDFDRRVIHGQATLTLAEPGSGPLDLDTRDLTIAKVVGADGEELPFELGDRDPVLGQRLRIDRPRPTASIGIHYETSPKASALMWLEPSQTAGGEHPFLLSQCQAIHARSIAPLQDSAGVRMAYDAEVTIPAALGAVMSAAPGVDGEAPEGQRRLTFAMPQPIPAYLLAIAVGELDARDLGPRTRVYAEPSVVEAAAYEFAEVEQMLEAAEKLFGPYAWDRYDFIVLPPSFPLGGMENPRMTFLTPTLLATDRSLVSVLAHELAHSWTGNLITNATNQDFWLNEGWTVYAERRIVEALYGEEQAAQHAQLGRVVLEQTLAERHGAGQSNALWYDQSGLDPDAEFSKVPYEKGFLFVSALEQAVGRERFDAFIARYMEDHRFQSLTSAEFLAFVREALPEAAGKVDLDEWLYAEDLPAGAPSFTSARLTELGDLAERWPVDEPPSPEGWTTNETLFFLSQLRPLDVEGTEALGRWLGLRETQNAELQCAWLARAAAAEVPGLEPELRAFIGHVGRTKLVKPVLSAMRECRSSKALAEELIAANSDRWHLSTRLALAT